MSALTDRIAVAHQRIFNAQFGRGPHCTCGWIHHDYDGSQKHVRHVAEVTEAAVREQVARDIEAFVDNGCDCLNTCSCGASDAYRHAARIAREGAA